MWILVILVLQCVRFTIAAFSDTEGTDFLLALPGQVSPGVSHLRVHSNFNSHLTVEAPFIGLSRTYAVTPGFTDITLDSGLQATGTEISFKGVRVKSDLPVTIYVVDYDLPSVGGYLALPVKSLAEEYLIMSYAPSRKSEFLIMSDRDRTKVTIHVKTKGNVTLNGVTFKNGEVIHETLDTFNSMQIQSDADLTGTLIKSDSNVAIFSGSSCAYVPEGSSYCDYVVEQMPPMSTYETRFIVPMLSTAKNMLRIVARDDNTEIKLQTGHFPETELLNSTDILEKDLSHRLSHDPIAIESKRPILVAHFTGGDPATNWGTSMTLVPSTVQYKSNYSFITDAAVDKYTAIITVPTNNKASLRVNGAAVRPTFVRDYVRSGLTDYSVLEVPIAAGIGTVTFQHPNDIPFGVLMYGTKKGHAFSFPLGYNMDLSISNSNLRLVDGPSPVRGRVEVSYHGNWGTVCGEGFSTEEANVVCRMIGFYFGAATPQVLRNAYYGMGHGHVTVESLNCDGYEVDISLCKSGPWEGTSCSHSKDVAVDCRTELRLSDSGDPREGRLEVLYNGQWGTVCDDDFGREEAAVVCRSIGFGDEGYFYTKGGGRGPQWLDDIQCSGNEIDIAQCMTKNWGISDCNHDEDVWVACFSPTKMRLTGGLTPSEGRVEIRIDNQWLSVCDSDFDQADAEVVCRMLGYKYKLSKATVMNHGHYGIGSGASIRASINCTGVEPDIAECPSHPWELGGCSHGHDAGVRCGSAVRLVNGTRSTNGRLEVFYKGHWGTVCDDHFTRNDALVVCKAIGFPEGVGLTPVIKGQYGSGVGNIVIDEMSCRGDETDVALCPSNPWLTNDCTHGNDVGVDCGSSIRLVGGSSPTEGRVEVYYRGQWGTVCGDSFDTRDAEVICRQMGLEYNNDRKVYYNAHYGQGSGPITIDEMKCSGNEDDVLFCLSAPWLTTDCSHHQDVGIDCGARLSDAITASCNAGRWSVTVDMHQLNRAFPNSNPSDLILGGQSCSRYIHGNFVTFDPTLHQCNTKEQTLSSSFVYTNVLQYAYHDPINPSIIRNYNWTVTMSCTVSRDGTYVIDIAEGNHGHSSGSISATTKFHTQVKYYSDRGFFNELPSNPLQLSINQMVYVKLFSTDADASTKMVLENCYAKPTNDPHETLQQMLIRNGCEVDSSTVMLQQAQHETTFQFRVFRFNDLYKDLYIHCDTKFCPLTDYSEECRQICRP